MRFIYDSENELGQDITLNDNEIKRIFEMVDLNESDIFYDLGSGNGEIVRQAITLKKVKKSNGIEEDYLRFLGAVVDSMSLLKRKETQRIDFWRGKFDKINFSEATVVYHGLSEEKKTVDMFNKVFKKKKNVRIIVSDIPFVGYRPVKVNRKDPKYPFFIMQTPLEEYRVEKKQWIKKVLGKKGTIKDVCSYYSKLLQDRVLEPKDRKDFMKSLRDLIEMRF